jgi:hypothetical protein
MLFMPRLADKFIESGGNSAPNRKDWLQACG